MNNPVLGGRVHTIKKNTEALLVGSKEIGLLVNGHKTKYMVMSRDQNIVRSQNINIDNSSFENVYEFICLGRNLTNRNPTQDKIKNRLNSGNVCYHSVQNILPSIFITTNIKYRYTQL